MVEMLNVGLGNLEGSSLLMHNGRLANPFDPYSLAVKAITSKPAKKKTEDDAMMLYRLEWLGGLYLPRLVPPSEADAATDRPTIPEANILSFINDGARFSRKGQDVYRGVQVMDAAFGAPDWPTAPLGKIFDGGEFTDVRSVVMPSGGRTMRCLSLIHI